MTKASFHHEIEALVKKGKIPAFVAEIVNKFYNAYSQAVARNGFTMDKLEPLLIQLIHLSAKQISHPYRFDSFHKGMRTPFDYYQFGIDFIKPLIDIKDSFLGGQEVLDRIEMQLAKGENVILFANHQIEPDPQVISIILEPTHRKIAEEMIFVAGHRVVTDPLAVPFSLGRNLICIYSKKHVENPPEQKAEKLTHNQQAMRKMQELLVKGGKCIYVAPSGGRDRPANDGTLRPAKLDPQSVDLFLLIARQAKTPTHFYPLSLATYHLLPPPNTVEKEIGEVRSPSLTPVYIYFGEELDIEALASGSEDKKMMRQKRAEAVWQRIDENYTFLEKKYQERFN